MSSNRKAAEPRRTPPSSNIQTPRAEYGGERGSVERQDRTTFADLEGVGFNRIARVRVQLIQIGGRGDWTLPDVVTRGGRAFQLYSPAYGGYRAVYREVRPGTAETPIRH